MAIVTGNDKDTNTSKKTNVINQANLDQLNQVIKTNSREQKTNEKEIDIKTEKSVVTAKKREYSDSVVINLPKGERNNFKIFCAQCNVTMTDYIYFAMDYIRDGVQEGRFTVSRSGIKAVKKEE